MGENVSPHDPAAVATVASRLAWHAMNTPDRIAVSCGDDELSFADLDTRARQVANSLRTLGLGAGDVVGVVLERSPRIVAVLTGIWQARACYLPVDVSVPPERVATLMRTAGARVVIAEEETLSGWPAEMADDPLRVDVSTLFVDDEAGGVRDGDAGHLPVGPVPGPSPSEAAYVVFTSGSSGEPKGVVVEHGSLVVMAREVAGRLGLGPEDRFLQFASPGFDVFAEELYPIWWAGGCVAFPTQDQTSAGASLIDILEETRATVAELPGTYFQEWARLLARTVTALPPTLRAIVIGSEPVVPERLESWRAFEVPLFNVYGLTEATVSSTFFRLDQNSRARDLAPLPIGSALASTSLYIMNEDLGTVAHGTPGELYIGGPGVARGYVNAPAQTAARFVADPHGCGTRLYRTGDLVQDRGDGNLLILGRADRQLKIRGVRVEPTDVAAVACRHPQVAEAHVIGVDVGDGATGLAVYAAPIPRTRISVSDLRRFLGRHLPPHMVPRFIVPVDRLPLGLNGKVDHDRLPDPWTGAEPEHEVGEVHAPQTRTEEMLAAIVAEVLAVSVVGRDDDFFALGGDSIQAIQVASRADEHGIGISPLDLFENPTVAQLGAKADARESEPVAPALATEPSPPGDDHDVSLEERFPLAGVATDQLEDLLRRLGDGS